MERQNENKGPVDRSSFPQKNARGKFRPFSLFLTILVSIFAAETLIMFCLGPFAAGPSASWALLDAFLLSLVIFPLLYYCFLKPMQRSFHARAKVETEKEAAMKFDRIKSEFISSAAHELLTPLTSIRGYVEILLSNDSDFGARQKKEFLDTVYHQTEVLERIVDDMLDLGRLESGQRIKLQMEPGNLLPVLENAAANFRQMFPGHELICRFPDEVPWLRMDSIRLGQVLANLLGNAAKYSDPGQRVELSALQRGNEMIVQVEDRGIGMTPDQLDHVFEYFYRIDTSDTKRSGLGLGLPISKLIIEEHGGVIDIESTPGDGTLVSFSLPLPEAGQ